MNYDKIKQALAENITTSTITKLAEHGIDKGDMQLILSLYLCQQLERVNNNLKDISNAFYNTAG